jgi:uncharacterized phage protein (TIGR02218 family)
MKTATPELIAYLANETEYIFAELYTITLVGGYVVRYTDCDVDLPYNGNTYQRFDIKRDSIKSSIGISVDEMKVRVSPEPTATLNGAPWISAARLGALDSAWLLVQRIYMPTVGDMSLGAIHKFEGRIANVNRVSRSGAEIMVRSPTEGLDVSMPRNLYQPGCLNTLFDSGCGLNKASYAVYGTVSSATTTTINSGLSTPDDTFTLGTIRFTSGMNSGISRTVRAFASGTFELALPLVTAPVLGDEFIAYPGCDRTLSTCHVKFANRLNYVGFPYVPDPENAT